MTEVVSFAAKKVEKTHDSKDWSPLDALKDCVRAIEAGEIAPGQIAVHYWEDVGKRRKRHGFFCAGLGYAEHIALLTVAIQSSIDDWRG